MVQQIEVEVDVFLVQVQAEIQELWQMLIVIGRFEIGHQTYENV